MRAVKGFGEKTERRILESIRALARREAPPRQPRAAPPRARRRERLLAYLRAVPGVTARRVRRRPAPLDGDRRSAGRGRGRAQARAALDGALAFPLLAPAAPARASARATLVDGCRSSCGRHAARYAAALLAATGSAAHLAPSRRSPGSATWISSARPARTRPQLYRRLGLPFIPPELREGAGEIEAARAGALPDDLVALGDMRGLVHCHTTYSDGRDTIEEMARAAEALGMRYLTITDHSPTAHYAGGLDVDRLKREWDEIARVQERVTVRLLRGTESDILADGALDYPDAVLEQLDVVIASVHARHRMDADA